MDCISRLALLCESMREMIAAGHSVAQIQGVYPSPQQSGVAERVDAVMRRFGIERPYVVAGVQAWIASG